MNNSISKEIDPPTTTTNDDDERAATSSSCSNKDAIKLNFVGGFRRRGMEPSGTNTTTASQTSQQHRISSSSSHKKKHQQSFWDINKGVLMLYVMCIYCIISTLLKMNNRNSQLLIISPSPQPPSSDHHHHHHHHHHDTIYIVQYNKSSSSPPAVNNNTVPVKEMNTLPLSYEQQKQLLKQQQEFVQKQQHPPSMFKIRDYQPCVSSHFIKSQIDLIETAHEHNIRIFPRNGYLLGAIRHGGFLPNEKVDVDLAVMYEDIINKYDDMKEPFNKPFKLKSNKTSIVYTFEPLLDYKRYECFDGRNPTTNEKYKFIEMRVYGGGKTFDSDCILPYYDNTTTSTGVAVVEKKQFYPLYAVRGFNLIGSLKEKERYRKEGGSRRVLGTGNENKSLIEDVGKVNIGTVFESQWFEKLIHVPFYYQQMLVPIGYYNILKGFYGRNFMTVENRKDWEAIPVSQEENERYLKYGPLAMCSY